MINKRIDVLMSRLYRFIGLFCIIIISTMFGIIVSDLTKSEYIFSVTPNKYLPTVISSEGGFYSNSLIIVGSGKAELYMEIVDIHNEVHYEYEKVIVSAIGTILDKNVSLHIPPLKPGLYKIRGLLYYSANLIMQSKIQIDMGVIKVEGKDEQI